MSRTPGTATGWLAAASGAFVGRTLGTIHSANSYPFCTATGGPGASFLEGLSMLRFTLPQESPSTTVTHNRYHARNCPQTNHGKRKTINFITPPSAVNSQSSTKHPINIEPENWHKAPSRPERDHCPTPNQLKENNIHQTPHFSNFVPPVPSQHTPKAVPALLGNVFTTRNPLIPNRLSPRQPSGPARTPPKSLDRSV